MRKRTKQILLFGGVVLALLLATSPLLICHAQKKGDGQKVENQDEQLRQARAAVAKSTVGSVFLETLSVREPSWSLDKAAFFERERVQNNEFTYLSMSLRKGDKLAGVDILECDSTRDADRQFGSSATRSHGISIPFNNYGDKGDKLVGQNGDLIAIRFRKGNFFVTVWNGDQKTAESFATYVLNSLGDTAAK